MTNVGIVFVLIRVALAACHKGFFVFPHHLEVSVRDFDGGFAPRRVEVRAAVLSTFAAISKVTMSFI